MSYQLGVTPANMQDLTDLGLPDPLWNPLSDWTAFAEVRMTGSGLAQGVGLPRFTWRFNELSIAQVGTLLYYVSTAGALQASKWVYVQTRVASPDMTVKTFQSYRALMMLPSEPDGMRYDVNEKYRDVTVRFTFAEAI